MLSLIWPISRDRFSHRKLGVVKFEFFTRDRPSVVCGVVCTPFAHSAGLGGIPIKFNAHVPPCTVHECWGTSFAILVTAACCQWEAWQEIHQCDNYTFELTYRHIDIHTHTHNAQTHTPIHTHTHTHTHSREHGLFTSVRSWSNTNAPCTQRPLKHFLNVQ